MNRLAAVAFGCLCVLAGGVAAHALSMERSRFNDVLAGSDFVVVADVIEVRGLPERDWLATARVTEVWKGHARDTVSYGPSAESGKCINGDTSDARVGDRAILFLSADPGRASLLRIALWGRGRLPIFRLAQDELVDIGAFQLPDGLTPTRAVVGGWERELLPLEKVRSVINKLSQDGGSDHR